MNHDPEPKPDDDQADDTATDTGSTDGDDAATAPPADDGAVEST